MENKIIEALKELCIPMGNKGFRYTLTAVATVLEDESKIDNMTNAGGIYDTVAKKYGTTISRVERAIRHGAEISASKVSDETQKKYFGSAIGRVKNSEFIAGIAIVIKMQMEG